MPSPATVRSMLSLVHIKHLIVFISLSLIILAPSLAETPSNTGLQSPLSANDYLAFADSLALQAKAQHAKGHDLQAFRTYLQAIRTLERCGQSDRTLLLRSFSLQSATLALTDGLLEQYGNSASRLLMLRFLLPLYDKTINTAYALYQVTAKDTTYLDEAFLLSEKCRNIMLTEAIRSADLKQFRSVPDAIIQKQRHLNASIFIYRNLLDAVNDASQHDTMKAAIYADSLQFFQQQSDSLNYYFSKRYPAYYQLVHRTSFIGADAICKQLRGSKKALLKYYCSDHIIYVFICTASTRVMLDIPKDSLIPPTMAALQESMFRGRSGDFSRAAFGLYSMLLKPAEAHLKGCDHIRVVTDSYLANLPFECLLASEPRQGQAFKEFDYLIRHYCFSYAPSATLAFEPAVVRSVLSDKRMIGFAPVFSQQMKDAYSATAGSRRDSLWLSLPEQRWSLRFAENMGEIIDGQWFTDTSATAARFRAMAGDYSIIHIASHTLADVQDPMDARIVFAQDNHDTATTNAYIKASDLYALDLNASLAVLGSCATGQGKSSKGEGMISLAYAFNYAGCRSLVYSLWDVDEKETASLMLNFYKGINEGLDKDDALHQAKLAMLDEATDITANPYYWSGFVISGDTAPIVGLNTTSNKFLWLGVSCSVLVCMMLLLYWRKRRSLK